MSQALANAVVRAVHELQARWNELATASPATSFEEGYEKGARDVLVDLQRLIAEHVVQAFLDTPTTVMRSPKQATS